MEVNDDEYELEEFKIYGRFSLAWSTSEFTASEDISIIYIILVAFKFDYKANL